MYPCKSHQLLKGVALRRKRQPHYGGFYNNLIRRQSQTDAHIEAKIVEQASPSGGGDLTPNTIPFGKTCLAWATGIATLSGFAAIVEVSTADSCPPFDVHGERFDQSHFFGRFCRMVLMCDPFLLLYSEEDIEKYRDQLRRFDAGKQNKKCSDRELWEAKRIVEGALNCNSPLDDGEFVPHPFRMSGFLAFNVPISVSMISATSTMPLLFWAWVNQSQNAMINYYNRNPSSNMETKTILTSYAAAVTSALIVAFGLATAIQRRYPPVQAKALLKWVTFPSAIVAGCLNCYIVRSPEKETGVALMDQEGNIVLKGENSQVAASKGVNNTTLSRAILQLPYLIPPLVLSTQGVILYLARHPAMNIPMTTYVILTSFGLGLPTSLAVFPQISEMSVSEVEEKYRDLVNPATGKPYKVFYYNKGL